MGEGYAAKERGGMAACSEGAVCWVISAGYVTTQRKAFNNVMAFEPYRYISYLKQVMASLPYIKIYFKITLIAWKLKILWVWL